MVMPKKLNWCERSLAIAQNRGVDVKSCQVEHEVGHCSECLDYPWPQNNIKNGSVWPIG